MNKVLKCEKKSAYFIKMCQGNLIKEKKIGGWVKILLGKEKQARHKQEHGLHV